MDFTRGNFGQITSTYPEIVKALLTDAEKAGAWTEGIESDKKHRGSSINVDLYSWDEGSGIALVQVRECVFHPKRFNRVRKDYYLLGRNENGQVFAHPANVRASGRVVNGDISAGVKLALSRIWDCDERDLDDIVRNGDVAFVPIRALPNGAELVEGNSATIRDSHHVKALYDGQVWKLGQQLYVTGRAKIEHVKGQHPTARVRGGIWRVQAGIKARTWGFSAPTKD
ncbi:MAG: hypothetical protein V2A71_10460 [Candidatus Eisenbacteria bacterium]